MTEEERERARIELVGTQVERRQAKRIDALVAQVAELTRERNEAREERDFFDRERQNAVESLLATESEVTRLTRERDIARASLGHEKSRSERLVRERDEARKLATGYRQSAERECAEVTRLTEALAATERRVEGTCKTADDLATRLDDAEARVRELEAREGGVPQLDAQIVALRSELAQLRERVGRGEAMLSASSSHWASEVLRALRGQET